MNFEQWLEKNQYDIDFGNDTIDLMKQAYVAGHGQNTDDMNDIVSLGMIRDEQTNRIKELEARLKKAIEIADELAYAHGKWIEEDIDYEEFYSWREDLEE